MTYEEALYWHTHNGATMEQERESELLIKEALEKQIPKKPIRANRAVEKDGQLFMYDDNEYWKCPICTDYDVPLRENQQYCHYCGQKIDWGGTRLSVQSVEKK